MLDILKKILNCETETQRNREPMDLYKNPLTVIVLAGTKKSSCVMTHMRLLALCYVIGLT